ncbi:hypothetical protein ABT390_28740 [Streptomyces aurantiacus]|uniref:Uncharacterized protein n=1 Tax=Streptomyces aurantiacus JA 4570 TaxID=1286094 RepID=S3ZE80_9ACTN|nr:hypothetical protein [Streptomyces aurantiacus]EPH41976.1 hypothetical protein STRAU_4954 [Streptomyces aurantiacus JA 4570]
MPAYALRGAAGIVAALILAAGVWASWDSARYVMLSDGGRERGTLSLARCGDDTCTGPYAPASGGKSRDRVVIDRSVATPKGERIPVVVKPESDEAVRTGGPGFLHAWLPLGGALLLAAVVVAGGLRLNRTAGVLALAGGIQLTAAFAALSL